MISSILTHAGYRVGLYTSPHLFSFTERIRINGIPVEEDLWARLTGVLQPEIENVNKSAGLGELTTFEILTALAFTCFREMKVDFQVMEVGLGGRLDATNVIDPLVSVITSISHDHMEVLGDTIGKIAAEKAGIIKPGTSVVCSPQFPEAMQVIAGKCQEMGAKLFRVGHDVTWKETGFDEEDQSFHLAGMAREYDIKLPLLGQYQIENAATAVTAVEVLAETGIEILPENIIGGLKEVYWPGRLQVMQRRPLVIVDGAHNDYSIKKLGEALRYYFRFDRLILVIGASSDKDIRGIVSEAAYLTDNIIIARSRNPRAVTTDILESEFEYFGTTPRKEESISSAMKTALENSSPDDLICAAGSVFVVAEAMEYMTGLHSDAA